MVELLDVDIFWRRECTLDAGRHPIIRRSPVTVFRLAPNRLIVAVDGIRRLYSLASRTQHFIRHITSRSYLPEGRTSEFVVIACHSMIPHDPLQQSYDLGKASSVNRGKFGTPR
jgi:hypothetical protein